MNTFSISPWIVRDIVSSSVLANEVIGSCQYEWQISVFSIETKQAELWLGLREFEGFSKMTPIISAQSSRCVCVRALWERSTLMLNDRNCRSSRKFLPFSTLQIMCIVFLGLALSSSCRRDPKRGWAKKQFGIKLNRFGCSWWIKKHYLTNWNASA